MFDHSDLTPVYFYEVKRWGEDMETWCCGVGYNYSGAKGIYCNKCRKCLVTIPYYWFAGVKNL